MPRKRINEALDDVESVVGDLLKQAKKCNDRLQDAVRWVSMLEGNTDRVDGILDDLDNMIGNIVYELEVLGKKLY